MHRRTARGNRLGLILTGLLLLVGGAALLGGHQGVYGASGTKDTVYPDAASEFVHDNSGWLWPVAAALAIVLGLVFLRWLLVQPRTDTLRRLRVDSDDDSGDGSGRTTLAASAVTDAVEDDLDDVRGVRHASASLTGHGDAPTLWLSVTTDADADLGRIRRHISTTSLPAVRAALDQPDLPAQIVVEVSKRSAKSRDLR